MLDQGQLAADYQHTGCIATVAGEPCASLSLIANVGNMKGVHDS